MKKIIGYGTLTVLAILSVLLIRTEVADAHCQIPCGIYEHKARVTSMFEHVSTIEKSVKQIIKLAGKTDPKSQNQLVRWVGNKESHAGYIQEIIADYFLDQVVKPVPKTDKAAYDKYLIALKDHHLVIVLAMKAKQNAGLATVNKLRAAVKKLETYYH